MFGKKRNSEPAEASAVVDEKNHDLAALEDEHSAYLTARENGEEWAGRDPSVIKKEYDAAFNADRLSRDLNANTDPVVTREELNDRDVAFAIIFMGLKAAQREMGVRPDDVPNVVLANAAAMGITKSQVKTTRDLMRKVGIVERHYSSWDDATKSQRAELAYRASLMRPRGM